MSQTLIKSELENPVTVGIKLKKTLQLFACKCKFAEIFLSLHTSRYLFKKILTLFKTI